MSVKDTIILNPTDLKYLLIDSLRLYSDNIEFVDGNNPYRFTINKKSIYIYIKNVHESGKNRNNPDECRIQIGYTENFNAAINSKTDILCFGYFADEQIFTAWDPHEMRDRYNKKSTISKYSRFSVQREAAEEGISSYKDSNNLQVISFKPKYLGLYVDNFNNIHHLEPDELKILINKSDEVIEEELIKFNNQTLHIMHAQRKRDPAFKKYVNEAYNNQCAMCGIQLQLIEAAHIVPHSHEKGTDDVNNGIALCALHHTAYDRGLIYFDEEYQILINHSKMEYLEKIKLDSGYRKFQNLHFDKLQLPQNHSSFPLVENIKIANQIRGIVLS